jgi:hypothetical protein
MAGKNTARVTLPCCDNNIIIRIFNITVPGILPGTFFIKDKPLPGNTGIPIKGKL